MFTTLTAGNFELMKLLKLPVLPELLELPKLLGVPELVQLLELL